MSDDAIQYWNAWKATYGEKLQKNIYVPGMLIDHGEPHLPDTLIMFRPELKFTPN